MPQYHLSKNQISELIEGSVSIRIALPLPPQWGSDNWEGASPDGLKAWAGRMLPPAIAVFILRAEMQDLMVTPMFVGKPSSLTELLGVIVETPPSDRMAYWIRACVVTLEPPGARRQAERIQWPKDFVIAGKSVLVKTETAAEKPARETN